jgi:hypothetical protein
MVEAVMRQCALKKLPFIVCVLYPLGGLGLANNAVAKIQEEFPDLRYGVDYVNLGFKDGPAAAMRAMGENIAGAFPTDARGTPLSEIPIMKGVQSLRQVKLVFTAATGVIGEYWITQVYPQVGAGHIGPTVAAPKYYATNSGQLVGGWWDEGAAEVRDLGVTSIPDGDVLQDHPRLHGGRRRADRAPSHFWPRPGNIAYIARAAAARGKA